MLHQPSEPVATHSLMSIHPDETLYSWCAANHFMSSSRNAATTALALLGTSHAVRQHEFPHSLEKFMAVSGVGFTSTLRLLRLHTVAGFYLPFLSRQVQQELASEAMEPQSVHWMRSFLGSSRTQKVAHPLKWCRKCIQEDIEAFGRPYWHTTHQYPIALVCTRHYEPLRWSESRSKHWRLPHKEGNFAITLPDHLLQEAYSATALSASLQSMEGIDMASLRRFALQRLQEIGVIHSVKGAKHERVARWFTSTSSCSLARLVQPKLTMLIQGISIPGLLWRQKKATAISWVLLWSALQWASPESAVQSFADAAAGRCPPVQGQLQLFDELETHSRKTPEFVRNAFETCDSYADVMEHLSVSRHDVVRWLENDPELRAEWRTRLREGRRCECIERIKNFVQCAPQSGRAELEVNCSAEIRWMREHAPSRLTALIKSIPSRSPKQFQFKY